MSLSKKIITKITKNTPTLLASILKLPAIAEKGAWMISYDKLTDALYFTPRVIPKNAVLFNVNRELAIYVTAQLTIKGVFIENFSANFVKHNKDFSDLLTVLDKKIDDDIYTTDDKPTSKLYQRALEQTLFEALNDKKNLLSSAKSLSI